MSITYREAVSADLQTLIALRFAYLTDYLACSLGNTIHAVVTEQDGEPICSFDCGKRESAVVNQEVLSGAFCFAKLSLISGMDAPISVILKLNGG